MIGDPPIKVHSQKRLLEEVCAIVLSEPPTGLFYLYTWADRVLIAECASPKALARWAFDGGAKSVRHDYDLAVKP